MRKLFTNQKGASTAEYALQIAFVAIAAVTGMDYIGKGVNAKLTEAGFCLKAVDATACG